MTTKKLPPVHPGEVLLEEFLKPLRLSQNRLALSIGVPPRRVNEIYSQGAWPRRGCLRLSDSRKQYVAFLRLRQTHVKAKLLRVFGFGTEADQALAALEQGGVPKQGKAAAFAKEEGSCGRLILTDAW